MRVSQLPTSGLERSRSTADACACVIHANRRAPLRNTAFPPSRLLDNCRGQPLVRVDVQLADESHEPHPPITSGLSANGKLSPRTRSSPVIRLSHQSLDVTLAYLKGKDAESEEAQEHANSSSLALYA